MAGFAIDLAFSVTMALIASAAILCLLMATELAFPQEAPMPVRRRIRVLGLAALFTAMTVAAIMLSAQVFYALGFKPIIPRLGWWADAILAGLLADFIYYWFHRMQHSIPWLWRIHSVHHAQQLGAGTGYHHALEAPLKAFLVTFPAAIIFGGHGGAIAGWVWAVQGNYVHSTTRLNFGRFAWIVCDNRVHRIHHSTNPEHFDRNFGVVTLLWDRLFGTAYFPRDEWPTVGLDDRTEPRLADLFALKSQHPRVVAYGRSRRPGDECVNQVLRRTNKGGVEH